MKTSKAESIDPCLIATQREQIGVFCIFFITLFQEMKQHRVEVPCVSPKSHSPPSPGGDHSTACGSMIPCISYMHGHPQILRLFCISVYTDGVISHIKVGWQLFFHLLLEVLDLLV